MELNQLFGKSMRNLTVKLFKVKTKGLFPEKDLRYSTALSMIFFHILAKCDFLLFPLGLLRIQFKDGKASLIQAASVSIHQSHGQYIENIHLQTYTSEQHFWDVLYREQYSKLFTKATEFLDATGGPGDDVMIFIRSALPSFSALDCLIKYLVAGWMLASMNMNRCRDTTARFQHHFIIASLAILLPLAMCMPEEGL